MPNPVVPRVLAGASATEWAPFNPSSGKHMRPGVMYRTANGCLVQVTNTFWGDPDQWPALHTYGPRYSTLTPTLIAATIAYNTRLELCRMPARDPYTSQGCWLYHAGTGRLLNSGARTEGLAIQFQKEILCPSSSAG